MKTNKVIHSQHPPSILGTWIKIVNNNPNGLIIKKKSFNPEIVNDYNN